MPETPARSAGLGGLARNPSGWTCPASTFREHAGTSVREPSSSTTQTRQTLTGVRVSRKQSVGVSIPSFLAASRIVAPSGTETDWPSILISIERRSGAGGATGTGPRGTGIVALGASSGGFSAEVSLMKINSIGSRRIPARSRPFGRGRKLRHRAWLGPSRAAVRFPAAAVPSGRGVDQSLQQLPADAPRRRGTERTGRRFHGGKKSRCAAEFCSGRRCRRKA